MSASWLERKSPPAAWEGYFLIGVFPRTSDVRWCKVQLFSGGRDRSRHCLSSVEGMDGDGQVLVLRGRRDRVDRHELLFPRGQMEVSERGDSIRAPDVEWRGDLGETKVRCENGFVAKARASEVLTWIDLPLVLTYRSAFGEIELDGVRGAALLEHAWGSDLPIDLARWGPKRWQWDVLAFSDGGACAVLTVDLATGLFGIRGGGVMPGEGFRTGSLSRIDVDAWDDDGGRRVPARWRGQLRFDDATLRYEAERTTPVAKVVPGGGFVGFEFTARWKGRDLSGTGFTEYRGG